MSDNNDTDLVDYRGKIDREEWHEFKNNVPRTIALEEKVNKLVRKFNREHREEDH